MISGTNFGATQGTSTVKFNGTAASPTSWSATSIAVPVPAGATTGNVVVTVGGVASNGISFTVTSAAPAISSLSPASGAVGTAVMISGTNFGATQGTSTVKFNGTAASRRAGARRASRCPCRAGATTGNVVVTVGGVASNGISFHGDSTAPAITSLSPVHGHGGDGGDDQRDELRSDAGDEHSDVQRDGGDARRVGARRASRCPCRAGATTGNVVVTVGGVASNGISFTVTLAAPSDHAA